MYSLGYEKAPYPGTGDSLTTKIVPSFKPEEADEFFRLVERYLVANGVGFDRVCGMCAKEIAQQCRKDFD